MVALVITDDPDTIDRRVRDYRDSIGFQSSHEFKFYRTDRRRRIEFLQMVATMPLRIRLLILDITFMTNPQLQKRESFYSFILKAMLDRSREAVDGAILVVDRNDKSKKNQQTLTAYLKKTRGDARNAAQILRVKHHDSRSYGALQIADMVAGAAMASHKNGDHHFVDIIRPRIEDEWIWRPFDSAS